MVWFTIADVATNQRGRVTRWTDLDLACLQAGIWRAAGRRAKVIGHLNGRAFRVN